MVSSEIKEDREAAATQCGKRHYGVLDAVKSTVLVLFTYQINYCFSRIPMNDHMTGSKRTRDNRVTFVCEPGIFLPRSSALPVASYAITLLALRCAAVDKLLPGGVHVIVR